MEIKAKVEGLEKSEAKEKCQKGELKVVSQEKSKVKVENRIIVR